MVNLPHIWLPRTSITNENVHAVEKLILEDRRSSIRGMVENLGISVGSIEKIIRERLG